MSTIKTLLREALDNIQNHDFEYKGYDCRIPYIKHRDAYGCQVYKNGEYLRAIKGWLPLKRAIEEAKFMVDALIKEQ